METTMGADDFHPPLPTEVPEGLTRPTSKYRFHAWLAMAGLLAFAGIYLALIAWFAHSAWREGVRMVNQGSLGDGIAAFCSAVVAVFLAKGLFFRKKAAGGGGGYEITAEQEPKLFEFIHRVADESRAPRPHKVYLSAAVNACVFYDISLVNFLFPTRKNLDIGLGLVNVLTLSEFKAVLAHEFGHFAQRSMAVGRWVYTAQQVANQLIYHRDALDKMLNVISGIDLRIAWIGWLLRLVVWALRAVLQSLLHLVMLAERALSREMEFQADLVAVSTTGSDALIHGLFRLPAADQAWEEAKELVGKRLAAGRKPGDLFAIQTRVLEQKRRVLDDPDFGQVPPLPATDRAGHRLFNADIAQPPQMWSTHPQSHLREANAKRIYVPAELDERSAWRCFVDPEGLRKKFTCYLFEELKQEEEPVEATLEAVDLEYGKEFLQPRYRGLYLGRSLCDHAAVVADLHGSEDERISGELYPASLVEHLEKMRHLEKEKSMLEALRDRRLESPDGVIRFRGEVIRRSGLRAAIRTSAADHALQHEELVRLDRRIRHHHLALARDLPGSWEDYLKGLLAVLHYADHSLRNLLDANCKLGNTFAVVTADGNVSGSEMNRLLADAGDLYHTLADIFRQRPQVVPDRRVLDRLGEESWRKCFADEQFKFLAPSSHNLGDWLGAVGGWVSAAAQPLQRLYDAALEQLLVTEALVSEAAENGGNPGATPAPSSVPPEYRVLVRGTERSLQTKLNLWDRFQTASGFLPAMARLGVAGGIVAGAVFITLPEAWQKAVMGWFQ
ncbi:M48 family metallopeptidase [Haloferula sargassicola]|uniref:Protease HtpX n=1 Tax=Haloferula sargassicola TaxID=490096 RepID=A0ABP9UI00_9BACT